jgi:putative IMPACT (imprinted ancient) family translation regulator
LTGRVNKTLAKYGIRVKDQDYDDGPTARVEVRTSLLDELKKALIEVTNGQIRFKS